MKRKVCDDGAAGASSPSCTGDLRVGSGDPGHQPLHGVLRRVDTKYVLDLDACTCFGGTTIVPMTDVVTLAASDKAPLDAALAGRAVVVEWSSVSGPTAGGAARGESADVVVEVVSVMPAR